MARKVNNSSKKPRSSVKGNRPVDSDSPLTFDLSNKNWLKSVNIKNDNYTNMLRNEKEFIDYITQLFHGLIPLIHQNGKEMIKGAGKKWRHCHPVQDEKIDLVQKVTEEIGIDFKSDQDGKKAGPQFWQFGVKGNLRLIAIYDYTNNSLKPLFIDYHHLIHPSIKYNQLDYENYSFCPLEESLKPSL
ncbi:hypothetical protein J32TS6_19370 [Virgibacillus pantothenticus]|uniref:hypothetical protein n=1 Tax=Virgibacillus pantothenticus TaxID=1473 RepID=UPI001B166120|nr:hypothetical protein [Virgibacillus pantothenticus]GIP63382.1 hypothetical protein J32TS6_19370 [Virgibacillus pantothenticus]